MLCEDDYEEDDGKDHDDYDDDGEENMTRPSFGLILLARTAKSPGNITHFPLKLVSSSHYMEACYA